MTTNAFNDAEWGENGLDLSELEQALLDLPELEPPVELPPLAAADEQFLAEFGDYLPGLAPAGPAAPEAQERREFGRYLRALRCAAGWDRAGLAARLGRSEAQLLALEQGWPTAGEIEQGLLERLAEIFEIEPVELALSLGRVEPRLPVEPSSSGPAAHHLAMLHEINLKMHQALDLPAMLHTALAEAGPVVEAEAGLIYLVDPGQLEAVTLAAAWPAAEPELARSAERRRCAEYVVHAGEIYHCPDIFEEAPAISPVDTEQFCAVLAVPIRLRHRVAGAIVVTSSLAYAFTLSDEQFLLALGDQLAASLAVQMQREVGAAVAQLDQRETLVKIVQSACYLMGTPSGAVVLINPETNRPWQQAIKFPRDEFTPRNEGLSRRVATATEPYLLFEVQHDPLVKPSTKAKGLQTILGMPIKGRAPAAGPAAAQTLGVIFVNSMTVRHFDAPDIALLQGLAGQAAVAIEKTNLYQTARRECAQLNFLVSRLTALHEATQQVRSSGDLHSLLQLIAQEAAHLLQAEAADIVLQDHPSPRRRTCAGFPLAGRPDQPLSRAAVEQVLALGGPVRRHAPLEPGITSLVSLPLALNGQVRGALTVYAQQPQRQFTAQEQEGLGLLAAQVSVVIQTALNVQRHYQHTRALEAWREGALRLTGRDQLPALVKLVLVQAVKLLRASGGRLYLVDEVRQQFTLIEATAGLEEHLGLTESIGDSLIGRVIATRAPFSVADYRHWPHRLPVYDAHQFRAVVGVPIICGGQVWGVISIHDNRQARSFSQAEINLLTHFGRLAALMLENFDQVAGDAAKLNRLKRLTQASGSLMELARSLSGQDCVKFVAMQVMRLLEVDNCDIALLCPHEQIVRQGVFAQRGGGRVMKNFIELPGDYIQREIAGLTPYHHRRLTIPWQTMARPLPLERAAACPRPHSLTVPLLKQEPGGERVIGLLQVTYSPKPPFILGAGFSGEDEWLLRTFADAVTVVLADLLGQGQPAAAP